MMSLSNHVYISDAKSIKSAAPEIIPLELKDRKIKSWFEDDLSNGVPAEFTLTLKDITTWRKDDLRIRGACCQNDC